MARPAHLVAVLGVAAAVRLLWAVEVTSSPLAFLSELPETDMHWYDLWGREIAAGDWLGKDLTLLYTAWQKPIASPEEWARWFGPPRYNPAPLYLYFLAGTYALAGPDPRVAIWLQAALGVGTCALLFAVASRAFGPRAGLCAGLGGALYGPLVFFEGFLLRTTLELCTILLFLHALLRARERARRLAFVLAGAAGGLAVLAQPTAGVFWVLAFPWVLLSARSRRAGLAELAALGLGLAIPLAVLAVRNLAVGAPLLAIESRGPFALVFGNMAGGRSPGIGFSIPPGAVDILRESDYRLLPALSAALRSHDSPLAFVAFLGRKLLAIASAFEVYNNVNYQEAVEQSRLLRVLPAFASAAGLGGVGVLLAHARRLRPAGTQRAARTLLGLYLLYGLACAGVSLVLSRYRMPLATGLLLCAGLAVAAGVDAIREGRRRRAAALALGALALGGLVSLDLGVSLPRFRPSEPAGIAQLYQARGRPGDAARVIEEALPRFADQPRVAALLHRQAAGYRSRAGDAPRARAHLEAALALEGREAP